MSVTGTLPRPPLTFRASMSWYLRPSHPLLAQSADLAGALTVTGRKGPSAIRRLRDFGLDVPVLFDGCGYAGEELPGAPWPTEILRVWSTTTSTRLAPWS